MKVNGCGAGRDPFRVVVAMMLMRVVVASESKEKLGLLGSVCGWASDALLRHWLIANFNPASANNFFDNEKRSI